MRRQRRIANDLAALEKLAAAQPHFSVKAFGDLILLQYEDTPGLVQTRRGVEICERWQATIRLPHYYPIDSPTVVLRPLGVAGIPHHPNVNEFPPFNLCYGRHLPDLLLDELARRIERMILLVPGSITTKEGDYLNGKASMYVRNLIRQGKAPLTPKRMASGDRSPGSPVGVPS